MRELRRLTTYVKKLGDVLNIFYIVNEAFFRRCNQVINPRNANTFRRLGTRFYTKAQLKAIKEFKERNSIN